MAETQQKVLIIEDDQNLLNHIKEALVDAGYQVLTSGDGKEGFTLAVQEEPDIIICDIGLPGENGMTVLKLLRSSQKFQTVPVIMLTNNDDLELVAEAMVENAASYLVKSDTSLQAIVDEVTRKLDEYKRSRIIKD